MARQIFVPKILCQPLGIPAPFLVINIPRKQQDIRVGSIHDPEGLVSLSHKVIGNIRARYLTGAVNPLRGAGARGQDFPERYVQMIAEVIQGFVGVGVARCAIRPDEAVVTKVIVFDEKPPEIADERIINHGRGPAKK